MDYARKMQRDADQELKRKNKLLLQDMIRSGIKFGVVRDDPETQLGGGAVFAFRENDEGIIEISAAYCHKHDQFKTLDGKALAGRRLLVGEVDIKLPKSRDNQRRLYTMLHGIMYE